MSAVAVLTIAGGIVIDGARSKALLVAGATSSTVAATLRKRGDILNLEEELKRQRQIAKKAEKNVKVRKNKTSYSQTGEREAVEKEDTAKQYAIFSILAQKCAIYFPHDRRKIIYVRITNRLGKSLCAHINDSLSKSWDRFSWLHLTSSVPSSGTLGRQPSSYDDSQVKLVLAATLIKVWEKGDRLKHAEYLQKVDLA